MSRRPQIEEIDDDGSIMTTTTTEDRFTEVQEGDDEEEFDDDFDMPLPDLPNTSGGGGSMSLPADPINPQGITYVQDTAQFKKWSCLYPIYFDAGKTTGQGRKVPLAAAVKNPLAKSLADAGKSLGFSVVFEPQKTHPADWSNPGRVRIQFKEDDRPANPRISTKRRLYAAISQFLQAHPTTSADPAKVPVPGLDPAKSTRAAVPMGMRINEILPLHSPATAGQGMDSDGLASMMGSMFPGMGGLMNNDSPSPAETPAPAPQINAPPKKPKMKRQIIR